MKELIIPIFALTALFVIPAIIGLIAILSWFNARKRLYQSIDDAIDNGAPQEVIDQLVALTKPKDEQEEKKPVIKHLTDGAFFVAVGIAFVVFFYNGGPREVIFPGVFCSLFGLSKFGIAAYAAKNPKT